MPEFIQAVMRAGNEGSGELYILPGTPCMHIDLPRGFHDLDASQKVRKQLLITEATDC